MMTASAVRPARGGDVLAEWAQNLTGQTAGRHAEAVCGSRFMAGSRLRTGKIR